MAGASDVRVPFHRALNELGGVVFQRFRPIPRVWAIWLVLVNAAAVAFIGHLEAQVALAAVVVAVVVQGLIYQRLRFVRVLGASHAPWLPMLVWLLLARVDSLSAEGTAFRYWIITLIVTNAISLVIDAIDVTRFVRGEREPHYRW